MTDIDALIADLKSIERETAMWAVSRIRGVVQKAITALTAERARVVELEGIADSWKQAHADNVREHEKLKAAYANHVDYLCRDQADLRDKLAAARAALTAHTEARGKE
jgi:hypothetical protein